MKHVSQSEEEKCIYHSSVRQRQAEETRRRILDTACSQLESCGYVVTTIEAMTEFGDISPKTIVAVFGSKRAGLSEVINPEAFSPSTRQLIEELHAREDVARQIEARRRWNQARLIAFLPSVCLFPPEG